MPTFEDLIKDKTERLLEIPLRLQTQLQKQELSILKEIEALLSELDIKKGEIVISKQNLEVISQIDEDLKKIFLNDEYVESVKQFANEFKTQSVLNNKIIKSGFGSVTTDIASDFYIASAKKSAINSLLGSPIDTEFVRPVQSILENSVANGSSLQDTVNSIRDFVKGSELKDSKLLRYVKQVTNDSFAIADRSYTSIVSDYLEAEWFYYAGGEIQTTRCFCKERVGNYFHYLEIESWGNGLNLGVCNIGNGRWAGMIDSTNAGTIYSYLGGWNCMHSLMPVSFAIVPKKDIERAKSLGFVD